MCIIHNIIVREFFMTHACMYVVFKCDLLQGQNTYILFFSVRYIVHVHHSTFKNHLSNLKCTFKYYVYILYVANW